MATIILEIRTPELPLRFVIQNREMLIFYLPLVAPIRLQIWQLVILDTLRQHWPEVWVGVLSTNLCKQQLPCI